MIVCNFPRPVNYYNTSFYQEISTVFLLSFLTLSSLFCEFMKTPIFRYDKVYFTNLL